MHIYVILHTPTRLIERISEVKIEQNIGVMLEDSELLECDTMSEDDSVQYQFCEVNTNDDGVAYQIVQVNQNNLDDTKLSIAHPVNGSVQILTSPINGQLYVLSNGNEVVATNTLKADQPGIAKLQVDTHENVNSGMRKRDERRRVTHNEVERRRRDKINNWIMKLGKLLPEINQSSNGEGDMKGNCESQSKGGILARACDYITELRETQATLIHKLEENTQLLEEAKNLRQIVNQLKKENSDLKDRISSPDFILGT
ncbi:upstream stimulatory factor 2-like isoform X2 [Prorops nasuta]|uniref:upstream stimulatory factor 2-like isoform X2 n=1 Tax=Prorops nasuta TaxID=863751 RepID=UPI0034CFB7B4